MAPSTAKDRTEARHAVLDGLARLRAAFPLEARVLGAPAALRADYAEVLAHWLTAAIPPAGLIAPDALAALTALDAVVPHERGLGCYPFSARDTGIRVALPQGTVPAMCAVDALAVARLARAPVSIAADCAVCGTPLACRIEANGGLDHDQAGAARVVWKHHCATSGSCSENLCRSLLFLCPACAAPAGGSVYTLPQAAAIGNAFFAFQAALLDARVTPA